MYKYLFPGPRWRKFDKKICSLLDKESILLTGIPHSGLTSYQKYFEEIYPKISNDKKTIIISFRILPNQTQIPFISSLIHEQLNYKLRISLKKNLLSTEKLIYEILKSGKRLLILVNQFQELQKSPETMIYLQSLRKINSSDVRFFITSDIAFLTNPFDYKDADSLVSANCIYLPALNPKEITSLMKSYKKNNNWHTPLSLSKQIYNFSGGNIGLVKYLIKYISGNKNVKFVNNDIIKYPAIKYKLNDIYNKLKENCLLNNSKESLEILKKLNVIDTNNHLKINLLKPLLVDDSASMTDIRKLLSSQEQNLYNLLNSRLNKIITLDEISKTIWGNEETEKFSLWSIYKVISNLGRKLKKFNMQIKNYKGRGYSLVKI